MWSTYCIVGKHEQFCSETQPKYVITVTDALYVEDAAQKSNSLPCFVNISTTNWNFYKKFFAAVSHLCLHVTAKLCCIITTFD